MTNNPSHSSPLVSVILPCYNVEDYISRCLNCLLSQTFQNIEIICIDDCSTDNSNSLILSFVQQYSRVKLITQPQNYGAGKARNTGLATAQGHYIAFIDPDDYIDTNFIETLYTIGVKNKSDVIKGRMVIEDYTTHTSAISHLNLAISKNPFNFSGEHCTALYKKDFLTQNNITYPEDITTGEDVVFLSRVALAHPHIDTSDDASYHYTFNRPNSLDSQCLSHQKVLSRIKMLNYKLDMFKAAQFRNNNDKKIFTNLHILAPFWSTACKNFAINSDQELIISWLHTHKKHFLDKTLKGYLPKHIYQAIKYNDSTWLTHPSLHKHLFHRTTSTNGQQNFYIWGIKIYSHKP